MRNTGYVITLACCTLIADICQAYPSSSQLEDKLNTCRQEYKNLVEATNSELNKLKAQAPSNFPTIYKQKQNLLKNKADGCKKIKKQIEYIKEFEIKTQPVRTAPVGKKIGPKFRCFQLGQNWSEFEACAKSIGYEPQVTETKKNEVAFTLSGYKIDALLDETYHVKFMQFYGGEFWGTTHFDRHFLQAFVDNYNIDELIPDSRPNSFAILGVNLGPTVYYRGNIPGGRIEITPNLLRVIVEKTVPNSGYKF